MELNNLKEIKKALYREQKSKNNHELKNRLSKKAIKELNKTAFEYINRLSEDQIKTIMSIAF